MKVILLAAGKGSRLGDKDLPKPLTTLKNQQSLLGYQIEQLKSHLSLDDILVVVGYRKELIMDAFPQLLFVYNPAYEKENTAKSLLRALRKVKEDTLWINGDVIFHPSILDKIFKLDKTSMVVNVAPVGEEEVKYRCDDQGRITSVSKEVQNPFGEALGINFIKQMDLALLKKELELCHNMDYFEKGVESAIQKGMEVWSLPIANNLCTEVDFPEDLNRANQLIDSWKSSGN
jgi:choline kinase